jgi:excisionase family DNA binding protein
LALWVAQISISDKDVKYAIKCRKTALQLLNTAEAADYLRLKERKLYELVADGAIPCTKVTGRWLFPKAELDQWLASSLSRPDGMATVEPMPIVGGSHDPLLEWALRESHSGLATLPEGSEAGLARFAEGGVVAAAIHMHALDESVADANAAAVKSRGDLRGAVLLGFLRREQGLIVAGGNPKKIRAVADIAKGRARMAMRPAGAGAHLLLLALLHRAGIELKEISAVNPPCPTGPDIAQAISAGRADCGIATRSVANAAGLDFVPLEWERFDLVTHPRHYFRAPLQALFAFLRTPGFSARAQELGGYDVSDAGKVRFAP